MAAVTPEPQLVTIGFATSMPAVSNTFASSGSDFNVPSRFKSVA
jgi:hypothetical protein